MTHAASRHIHNINLDQPKNLSVIILAAGVGKRMKSYGPKTLLKYNNKNTILDLMLYNIWTVYPKADIILVVGFQREKFIPIKIKYPKLRIVYNPQHHTTNTMFSAQFGMQAVTTDNVIILHGDLLFNIKTLYNLVNYESKLVLHNNFPRDDIGVVCNQGRITNIAYGLDTKWGQIAYLTDKELSLFRKVVYGNNANRTFLYEGFKYILKNNGKLFPHIQNEQIIYDIDSCKDLEIAKGKI